MTHFIEACAGTAALSWALCGTKPPVPMMGSKRTIARAILDVMGISTVSSFTWNDPGEWGLTWQTLLAPGGFDAVADVISSADWLTANDRELFDYLRTMPPPTSPVHRAATHLYLQTRTYRGRAVYPYDVNDVRAGWATYGFDPEFRMAKSKSSGANDRGWFNARPVLAQKLRNLGKFAPRACMLRTSATDLMPPPGSVMYIDPPYVGTVGYGHFTLTRKDVLILAETCADRGASVFVSEAEPLPLPGWEHVHIPRRGGIQLGKHQEWLTFRRAPHG